MTDETKVRPGILQSEIVGELEKVPAELTKEPHLSFDGFAMLPSDVQDRFRHNFLCEDFTRYCTGLALEDLRHLPFDKLCKTAYSGGYMQEEVRRIFEANPNGPFHPELLIEKIRLSMWRWGYGDRDWNLVVDAWNGLKAFDLGVEGFSVELDYTPWHHRRGFGVRSETYLDGCFAFLVRWKDQHVMTIGFSFARDRGLLVQQIQTKSKRGNRWMYRFPKQRFEHILSCFARAFPNHDLLVVSGRSIGEKNIESYQSAIDDYQASIACNTKWAKVTDSDERHAEYLAEIEKIHPKIAELQAKIVVLKADLPRLDAMYADMGAFERVGRAVKLEGLRMYRVAPRPDDHGTLRIAA